jgi:tetratricopeptide (TPR) repeat protein
MGHPTTPHGLSVTVSDDPVRAVEVEGLTDLPAGLPRDASIQTPEDVLPYAAAALGTRSADQFLSVLRSPDDLAIVLEDTDTTEVYPYEHPALDPLLDASPLARRPTEATALGAALTLLAAQPRGAYHTAPAAFTVLVRAARTGECAPQLNLLLLLAADINTSADVLAREQGRAKAACPGDVTPDWLVAQRQLRLEPVAIPSRENAIRSTRTPEGISTMAKMLAHESTSVPALTGMGDANLSAAMFLVESQPFSARAFFRQALTAYNDAVEQGGGREAAPGLARVLIGLGQPERAAQVLHRYAEADTPGPVLEVLIAAYEASRDFGEAEAVGRRLARIGPTAYPDATTLVPVPQGSYSPVTLDDRSMALSLGADRLAPLAVFVVEIPKGGGADVVDRSFIPRFRDDPGLTDTTAACPSWSWRRNAVLAGHAAAALEDWPETFRGARPIPVQSGCISSNPDMLRAIAELEQGGSRTRQDLARDEVADARQNLLRWAGDMDGARRVAEEWKSRRGQQIALPVLRLAEIDFLDGRFDEAAAGFRIAARQERLSDWSNDLGVAQADLARGAALIAAGRGPEAEDILRPLDALATAGYAYQLEVDASVALDFAAVSYYACLELGDLERRSGRLRAATDDYEKAMSWLPVVSEWDVSVDSPEVVHNNAALAYLALGDTTRAAELADQALDGDPMNPAFLMTRGFVADRQGDRQLAVERNREALRSDPGAFPAANDLGVQLARIGDREAARRAFRQAVGARPDYELGWFNLGVLEASMGPGHLLPAQHALGEAFALEPALRGQVRWRGV